MGIAYEKQAKSLDEQIEILRDRKVIINDVEKAKEYLSDIGYYRLSLYLYPFEITYPCLDGRRCRDVKQGTTIDDVVALYYYDFDLRAILNKYLSRIEISVRSTIIYLLSLKYSTDQFWFVNPSVVSSRFKAAFDKEVYSRLKKKPEIKLHHSKYKGKYAPAWKTMEFMTMGNLETLYDNLIIDKDKRLVSISYGEPATATFKSYLSTIRTVRNACAHGNVMYGLNLEVGIKSGAACRSFVPGSNQNLYGALRVIDYMIRRISVNRAEDMWMQLQDATTVLCSKVPSLQMFIQAHTGIVVPEEKSSRS